MTARRRTLAAAAWSFAANWGQQLASTAIFFYLAYKLGPSDFGVVAMAAAVVDLLTLLARFGQVEALLQGGEETGSRDINTSYWFLIAVGVVLGFAILLLSRFADALYEDSRIPLILLLLAPIPLIQNLTLTHEYLLRREMAFKGIAVRNVSATMISGVVAVALAYTGFGYFALVAQKLIFTIVNSLALALYRRWLPQLVFDKGRVRALVAAGFNVALSNLTVMANTRVIDLFVGHYFGFVVLGNLRIAWRLFDLMLQFTLQPLASVAVSAFTENRASREKLAIQFTSYAGALALVAYPLFAGMLMISDEAIELMFGARWQMAGNMLLVLCFSFAVLPVNYLFSASMLAVQKTDTLRRQALAQFLFTLCTVAVSSQFSIGAVLTVHVLRVYLFSAYNFLAVRNAVGVSFKQLASVLVGPLVSVLGLVGAILIFRNFELEIDRVLHLALEVFLGGAVFVFITLVGEFLGLYTPCAKPFVSMILRKIRKSRHAK
jgi:PST family polysaccharide transporter